MPTFLVHFIDPERPDIHITCEEVVHRQDAFIGLNQDTEVAVWSEHHIEYVFRLEPPPQGAHLYCLTWHDGRPDDYLPTDGIQLDPSGEWTSGWDEIASIGYLRRTRLKGAIMIQSETVQVPTVVQAPSIVLPPIEPPPPEEPPAEDPPPEGE